MSKTTSPNLLWRSQSTALPSSATASTPRPRLLGDRPAIAALFVTIVVWEVGGQLLNFAFWPPLSAVAVAWWQLVLQGGLLSELALSLRTLFGGYALALAAALPVGIAMGRSRFVADFFDPFININLATPSIVYIPVLFALFGVGAGTRYAIVFLYAFFIMVVNIAAGVRHTDASLAEMGRAFGATELQLLRKIVLPGALPLILTGARLGLNRAVKGMINGEMFVALVGLGARLRTFGGSFQTEKMLAVLITVVVLGIVLNGGARYLERNLTRWAETAQHPD